MISPFLYYNAISIYLSVRDINLFGHFALYCTYPGSWVWPALYN